MTLTEKQLDEAVLRNIIDVDQRAALLALARGEIAARPDSGEEQFRFITGFNDIFLAIGVALFITAAALTANLFNFSPIGLAICAAALWGLSEVLTARLRRAIPSMLAAAAFVVFAVWATSGLAVDLFDTNKKHLNGAIQAYAIGTSATFWSLLYFVRFRLPFSIFLLAASIVWLGFVLSVHVVAGALSIDDPWSLDRIPAYYALVSGLSVFAVAMMCDRVDPRRVSLKGDYGFWLHLLAAPLIVHAVMFLATGLEFGGLDSGATMRSALLVVVLFGLLCAVALIVNRRAVLVAALTYLGGAVWYLMSQSDRTANNAELLSIMLISLFVIGLGVGWHAVRRRLIQIPPLDRLDHVLFSKQVHTP